MGDLLFEAKGVGKTYGANTVLRDIDMQVYSGEVIGLIGENGAGKSTLMKLISGVEKPSMGEMFRMGKPYSASSILDANHQGIGMVFQEQSLVGNLTIAQNIYLGREKGYSKCGFVNWNKMNQDAKKALGRIDMDLDPSRKVRDIDFAARQMVEIAKVLDVVTEAANGHAIILLDEPTNYLDEQHIEWLKRYLLEYENAFILISHDIPFLNSVVNIIYHMENQSLDRYVGDYDKFVEVHAVKKAQLEAAYKRQQQEIAELEDFVARNKARVSTRNMAMSRQKKLDKMDVIELAREKPKPEFHFLEARTAGKTIIETTDLIIGYDEPLSRPLNVRMERGEKIVLVGANGIGKTTLLKSILGLVPPLDGKVMLGDYLSIGYFEQEMAPGNKTTCIEEIWKEFPSYTQYQVRSALAKCGLTTKHIESQVRVLSGGEQAKVRLCKLINRETNVLLLDEPTNHLDVEAKEELKRALKEYKGSILLICHEPEFYEGVATKVWDCREWALKLS